MVVRISVSESPWDSNIHLTAFLLDNPWFRIYASDKVPSGLAYFRSWQDKQRQILTHSSAGKFLENYFRAFMSDAEIQRLAEAWAAWLTPTPLKIATTADEIESVIMNSVRTCMQKRNEEFQCGSNPMRILTDGDLAVAYIGSPTAPKGFAVVRKDTKSFSDRIYGLQFAMKIALEKAGYTWGPYSNFTGARVPVVKHGDDYIMPFIDTHRYAELRDDWFVLSEMATEFSPRSTKGLVIKQILEPIPVTLPGGGIAFINASLLRVENVVLNRLTRFNLEERVVEFYNPQAIPAEPTPPPPPLPGPSLPPVSINSSDWTGRR